MSNGDEVFKIQLTCRIRGARHHLWHFSWVYWQDRESLFLVFVCVTFFTNT